MIGTSNIIGTTAIQYEEQRKREFCDMLTKIINDNILPKYGQRVNKFNIELGLFTSDQYGSYRIPFFDVDGKVVCYIVADTIMGIWEVFEVKK